MLKKIIFTTIFLCLPFSTTLNALSDKIGPDCTFNGKKLYGKIKFVENFPDIKVQVVENFPDLKVKKVENFPDSCGVWKIVENFPDLTVKIVENFGDIKIKFVENFPGIE